MRYTRKELDEISHYRTYRLPPSPSLFSGGFLGKCPRCMTEGPCKESTCDSPAPEWDWQPGDTCMLRPFANRGFALQFLQTPYYNGSVRKPGSRIVRYWSDDGRVMKMYYRGWDNAMNKSIDPPILEDFEDTARY